MGSAGSSEPILRSVPRDSRFPVRQVARHALVGRDEDLRTLTDLLDGHRLITLTGTGGVGKTALASSLAERIAAGDGIPTLEVVLTAVKEADHVLDAVVGQAGWRGRGDPFDTLVTHIGDDPLLMVLDNLEQVISVGATLIRLLGTCPELRLVTTSRSPLRVAGETVFAVEPLSLPADAAIITAHSLSGSAVELFVDRARKADPAFELNGSNAAAVARICRRLDGLPLAIELAAARLDLVSAEELAALLERHPDALRSRQRSMTDERHRTMPATIEWSYRLLDTELQRVFRATAAFHGGFRIDALAAVTGLDQLAAIDAVGELVDHALVHRIRDSSAGLTGGASMRRYGTFEVIREFAKAELVTTGEADAVSEAQARWCAELVARTAPQLIADRSAEAMAELEADLDNIRLALRRSLDNDDVLTALSIGSKLRHFWWFRGTSGEGHQWLEDALSGGSEVAAELYADAIHTRGQLSGDTGHYSSALVDLEAAASIYEELDLPAQLAESWNGLAVAHRSLGDLDRAAALHDKVLSLDPSVETARAKAAAENGLGAVAYYRNDMASAARRWESALSGAREVGDLRGSAQVLGNLGVARLALGDVSGAIAAHTEAADLARAMGDLNGRLYAMVNLTDDHFAGGNLDEADACLAEATELAERCGDRYAQAVARVSAGQLAYRRGQPSIAFTELGDALSRFRALAADIDTALTLEMLGLVSAGVDQPEAAGYFALAAALRDSTASSAPEHEREALQAARLRSASVGGDPLPMTDLDDAERIARMLSTRCSGLVIAPPSSPDPTDARWADTGLTRREAEVALLVARAATDPEIAAELFISTRTASTHVSAVLRKLGIRSRRLVRRALIDRRLIGDTQV